MDKSAPLKGRSVHISEALVGRQRTFPGCSDLN